MFQICSYLSLRCLGSASRVCKAWNQQINGEDAYWSEKYEEDYAPLSKLEHSKSNLVGTFPRSCYSRDKYRQASANMMEEYIPFQILPERWVTNAIIFSYTNFLKKSDAYNFSDLSCHSVAIVERVSNTGSIEGLKFALENGLRLMERNFRYMAFALRGKNRYFVFYWMLAKNKELIELLLSLGFPIDIRYLNIPLEDLLSK